MVNNNPIDKWDKLGLAGCCGGKSIPSGKSCCANRRIYDPKKRCCYKNVTHYRRFTYGQCYARYKKCVKEAGGPINALIQGNPLSVEQVTAVLDGKRILAAPRDVQEIRNAIKAYDSMNLWNALSQEDLLKAHSELTLGLIDDSGQYRRGSAGVKRGEQLVHIAPPAHMVPALMNELLGYISKLELHPLIKSCIFHYEFEYIHPFSDGTDV